MWRAVASIGCSRDFLPHRPTPRRWRVAAALEGGESEIGRAMSALARVARATVPIQARDEFDVLFLGLVRGELVPYASFYRTGFLYDRPLAAVRSGSGDAGRGANGSFERARGSHRQLCAR